MITQVLPEQDMHCPICDSAESKFLDYKDDIWTHLATFDKLKIKTCINCGLGYSVPELPNQEVNLFYEKHYRAETSPFYTDYKALTENKSFDSRSAAQLLLVKQFINLPEKPVFLDIGPGSGKSFGSANKIMNKPTCIAIEPNEGAASALKRVYSAASFSSLTELIATGQMVDVILMSHTLEHFNITWLDNFLTQISQLMSPGAGLIIEVPHVDMRKHSEIRLLDAPHFIFFSKDSLRLLFENKGWEVLYCETCSKMYEDVSTQKNNEINENFGIRAAYKNIKKRSRNIVKRLPVWLRKVIHISFNAIKNKDLNINSDFEYCGNRTAIRLVARPQKNDG